MTEEMRAVRVVILATAASMNVRQGKKEHAADLLADVAKQAEELADDLLAEVWSESSERVG